MIQALKLLGQRIRELRKQRNMKVADLAKAVDLSEAQIYSIEIGRYGPTFATLTNIAHALRVSLVDVVNWTGAHIRFDLIELMREAPIEVLAEVKEFLLQRLPHQAEPPQAQATKAARK